MTKNIINFFRSYYILLIFLLMFTVYILPPCFQNNDNISVVSAEHIDSGSILSSILQLKDKTNRNSFYNQNIPYHTVYGFPYNSIMFWCYTIVENIFNINSTDNINIYPLIAKLANFLFASLFVIYLYRLSKNILKFDISRIILFSISLIFPAFLHYTFHIKPDILGLLFSIISLNYLYNFLQKPENIGNIIKANVFGALSALCKQPHIFIIFPLFIGLIFTLKGNYRENTIKFFKVYLYSGIIFIFLFFLIHPYAFIEPKAFILKQRSLLGMTSATSTDNLNYWVPTFFKDPLLFIIAFIPFVFVLLNTFKKFRNKITYYLVLISSYIIIYILWLSFKVGPMRFIAYLIPIFPLSILLFSYVFDYVLIQIIRSKILTNKIIFIIIAILFILLSIKIIKNTLSTSKATIDSVYVFKKSQTYMATKMMEEQFKESQLNNKTIIYSISLPVNIALYKKSDNTWQGLTKSDYLFIDFTVYWEKPYEYWKNIARQNGLTKEMLYINNTDKEKNIILFYK